jgi:hypothetical protein
MIFKLTEEQIIRMTTTLHDFIKRLRLDHVCRFVVLPPSVEENQFKVLLYINESELLNYDNFRERQEKLDNIVNLVWESIFDFFDIPTSVFIWKVKSC